jgi:two-component system chemotaxis response regulator CheB
MFAQSASDTRPVRALVVDDSALMRKLVSEILRSGGIEVVATAFDGEDALQKAARLAPDVITLDVEMPSMNGVEFLVRLMAERPAPVVMLSSLTEAGADITMRCLELGAVDCLQKPSGSISVDIGKMGGEIVARVRAAASARVRPGASSPGRAATRTPTPARVTDVTRIDTNCPIIAIASSTGGPAALSEVVPHLPGSLPAAVVIVQHLPVGFTRSLAMRLDSLSALDAHEAVEGEALRPGSVFIAPAGRHLAFDASGRVALHDDPSLWGVRPAADIMMRSAAERFGSRVIGAILTGMGRDGALGAKAIRQHGGWCVAQSEETCVIYGMPRAAVEGGGADRTAPLSDIAALLTERAERAAASQRAAA